MDSTLGGQSNFIVSPRFLMDRVHPMRWPLPDGLSNAPVLPNKIRSQATDIRKTWFHMVIAHGWHLYKGTSVLLMLLNYSTQQCLAQRLRIDLCCRGPSALQTHMRMITTATFSQLIGDAS